jgi:nitrate/nitrite-specific signal transduction histidine kinase
MSLSLKELFARTDEDIIRLHDGIAELDDRISKYAIEEVDYCLNELARRDQSRQTDAMVRYTWAITVMTAIMVIATILNLVIIFKH